MKKLIVLVGNPKGSELIQPALFEAGYRWGLSNGVARHIYGEVLYCYTGGSMTYSGLEYYEDRKQTEFQDWEVLDLRPLFPPAPKPPKIQLTADCDATVHFDIKEVEVGCQKIPFAKVAELSAIIAKGQS